MDVESEIRHTVWIIIYYQLYSHSNHAIFIVGFEIILDSEQIIYTQVIYVIYSGGWVTAESECVWLFLLFIFRLDFFLEILKKTNFALRCMQCVVMWIRCGCRSILGVLPRLVHKCSVCLSHLTPTVNETWVRVVHSVHHPFHYHFGSLFSWEYA